MIKILILLVIPMMLISVGFSSAYGELVDFTIDKEIYHNGDLLRVTGTSTYDLLSQYVTVNIFASEKLGDHVSKKVTSVNPDGTFATVFYVGGPTWGGSGNYVIMVYHGTNMMKSFQYDNYRAPTSELKEKAIEKYEKRIAKWHNAYVTLTERAEILDIQGKHKKANSLYLKASYFEMLIDNTRNFMYAHAPSHYE